MWTWVEPLYQPLAAMSVIGRSSTVRWCTSPASISTSSSTGQNSKPFTTTSFTAPAGSSTRNSPGWWNIGSSTPLARAYASEGAYNLPSDAVRCTREPVVSFEPATVVRTDSTPIGRRQRRSVMCTVICSPP